MKAAPSGLADARGLRVAILRSEFNPAVVEGLVAGARRALLEMGGSPDDWTEVSVPGAFELPIGAKAMAVSGGVDCVVALGAVIRGETDHYEHIARAATDGLAAVARETGVPIGFGVLTVDQESMAVARSGEGTGNKGAEAARAAVAMVHVVRRFPTSPRPEGRRKGSSSRRRTALRGRG